MVGNVDRFAGPAAANELALLRAHLFLDGSADKKIARRNGGPAIFRMPTVKSNQGLDDAGMCRSRALVICSLGTAPTICSTTWPSLKTSSVGMPRMLKRPAEFWASSTFSLVTFSLPAKSCAISATVGASMWHGRHHSAQKSTITGWALLAVTTSLSKLPSFTTRIFSAIRFLFPRPAAHRQPLSY